MAIILEGSGTVTGITTFTTPLDDIKFDSIEVTGIATAATFQVGTGVSIGNPRLQNLALYTNDTEFVTVDNAGNVGFGTTNAQIAAQASNAKVINAGIVTANQYFGNQLTAVGANITGVTTFTGNSTFGGDVTVPDKIIHTGDTDTAIRFAGTDIVTVETGGSESLRVDTTGTRIPDKLLHFGDADTMIRFPAADQISFETGGTEYLKLHRYSSVNFVEVGSAANLSLADNGANLRSIVIGDGDASSTGGLWLQPGGGSSGFGGAIQLYSHARYPNPGGVWIGTSSGATSQIDFGTSGTYNASAIKMSILSTGKVGIGVTNPSYHLEIKGSGTQQFAVTASDASDAVIRLNNSVLSWDFDADGNGTVGTGAAGSLHLRNSSLGDAAVMTFVSAGRVGIGSVIPSDRLSVDHSNTGNPTGITIRNTNTSNHSHARLKLISQNGAKYTDIWTDVPNDCCRIGYNSSNSLMINNGNAYAKTTVSNWHNDYRVFQAGQASMVGKNPQDGSPAYFSNNAYYDASDSRWEFISTDDACQIEMENGSIKFNNGNTGSANGAITWVTNATFNQSGNLAFGNGKGIDFSATPAPNQGTGSNELFNDYEEGTWTPSYGSSSVTASSYADTGGHYTKVGNLVTFTGRIQMSSSTVNGNDLTMGGFPYVVSSGARNGGFYMTYQDNWYASSSSGTAQITFLLVQGQSYGYFYDGDGTNVNADDCYDGVKRTMHFEGFYYTDA